jgi:hypothetical protein
MKNVIKPIRIALALSASALILSSQSGCAVAGLAMMSGFMSNQDKSQFHLVNLEREKAGLRPLSREEWKHQLNSGEVRHTHGDFAGVQHGGGIRTGESRPSGSR